MDLVLACSGFVFRNIPFEVVDECERIKSVVAEIPYRKSQSYDLSADNVSARREPAGSSTAFKACALQIFCPDAGVKKFVYASSSSVYGDEPNLPKTEGREGNLLSPYALTKRCDEEWGKQYHKHYGLKTIGLRYFNVFGRRQDPHGAYAAVIPIGLGR